MTKQEQRKYIKGLLRTVDAEVLCCQSEGASKRLCELHEFKSANTILAYVAMKRECDPALAVSIAREMGKDVAFPLCSTNDNTLIICVPKNENAFVVGAYGILEPDINQCRIIGYNDIDFVIVPGLAFDKECNRLGRGKGYYDRLLFETYAFCAGFAFNEQVIESVCIEIHDLPVHCVVTKDKKYEILK